MIMENVDLYKKLYDVLSSKESSFFEPYTFLSVRCSLNKKTIVLKGSGEVSYDMVDLSLDYNMRDKFAKLYQRILDDNYKRIKSETIENLKKDLNL